MPKISRVRIANLYYDDRKKLIIDETYNLLADQNTTATHTLFSLQNGGGKSVLIQMLLQPIIPNTAIGKRRIIDYLPDRKDHFFVLLEWIRENTSDRILTGIAYRRAQPRQNSHMQDDYERINYYTFFATYSPQKDGCSLLSDLELTYKKGGSTYAQPYDYVREYAKANKKNDLQCFSSDRGEEWRKKLNDYGINQSVMKLEAEINKREGDLGELFDDCRTSDQLVNNFFLPHINKTITESASGKKKEDRLSDVANECVRTIIERKEAIKEIDELRKLKSALEKDGVAVGGELLLSEIRYERGVSQLLGFEKAVNEKINTQKQLIDDENEQLALFAEKKKRIEYEKCSEHFYAHSEKAIHVRQELETLNIEKNEAEENKRTTKQKLQILRCAKEFGDLKKLQAQLSAVEAGIKEKTSDFESNEALAELEYALFVKVNEAYNEQDAQLKVQKDMVRNTQEKLEACGENLQMHLEEKNKKHDWSVRCESDLASAQKEVDKLLKNLQQPRERYEDRPIQKLQQQKDDGTKKLQDFTREKTQNEVSLHQAQERQPHIQKEIYDKKALKLQEKQILKLLEKAKTDFEAHDYKIKAICTKYNMPLETRFSERFIDDLETKKEGLSAELYSTQKAMDTLKNQLEAIAKKSLHVHHSVLAYLNEKGIAYQTCEEYLEAQKTNGIFDGSDVVELLEKYPMMAYGIILDEQNKTRLLADNNQWLPVSVPLFSVKDIENILVGTYAYGEDSLANYSKEYFLSPKTYQNQCEAQLREKEAFLGTVKRALRQIENDIAVARYSGNTFIYAESWAFEQNHKISESQKALERFEQEMEMLQREEQSNKEAQAALKKKLEKITDTIAISTRKLEIIDQCLERLKEEIVAAQALEVAKKNEAEVTKAYDEIKKDYNALREAEIEQEKELENAKKAIDVLIIKKEQYKEMPEKPLREETWQELEEEYNQLKVAISNGIDLLEQQKEMLMRDKIEKERIIESFQLAQNMYCDVVWTLDEEKAMQKKETVLEEKLSETLSKLNIKSEEHGKCQADVKNSVEQLKKYNENAEPLQKDEIYGEYSTRTVAVAEQTEAANQKLAAAQSCKSDLEKVAVRIEGALSDEERAYTVAVDIVLEEDVQVQFKMLEKAKKETEKQYKFKKSSLVNNLYAISSAHQTAQSTIVKQCAISLEDCAAKIANGQKQPAEGNKILEKNLEALNKRLDMEGEKERLLEEMKLRIKERCAFRGEALYDEMRKIEEGSKINENGTRRKMVKTDIPVITREGREEAENRVKLYVEGELDNLVKKITQTNETVDSKEISRSIDRMIDNGILLRKYINKEIINVQCYKVEKNGGRYRSWKDTREKNSGAEGFVAYLAITLALLHYKSNSNIGTIFDDNQQNVLFLDNPFAKSTSTHVVTKMFQMADHYNTQLVCFSAAEESQITANFDVINKLRLEKFRLNDFDILVQDSPCEEETLMHGYMREQPTLF